MGWVYSSRRLFELYALLQVRPRPVSCVMRLHRRGHLGVVLARETLMLLLFLVLPIGIVQLIIAVVPLRGTLRPFPRLRVFDMLTVGLKEGHPSR